MEKSLVSIFGDIKHTKLGGADSFSDQLSCKYTVFLLILFVIISTTKVYIKEPIACFVQEGWSGSRVDFVNKVCWVSETYSLPEQELPDYSKATAQSKDPINYYQWVTLLMVGQAFLFYLPRPIWRMLNKKSGIPVSSITDAAIECYRKADSTLTNTTLKNMTAHLARLVSDNGERKRRARNCCLGQIRHSGNYLVVAYIFVKTLYFANAVGQLYLLSDFLNTDYHLYGFHVLGDLISGKAPTGPERFPKITVCHFNIKVLGNVQRHSVECVLPMNFYYKVMFILLWFWIVLVACITAFSLLSWIFSFVFFGCHVDSIRSALIDMKRIGPDHSDDATNKFVRSFLRRDGCFILKLVGKNSSDVIMTELICCLWDLYVERSELYSRITAMPEPRNEVCPNQIYPEVPDRPLEFAPQPSNPSASHYGDRRNQDGIHFTAAPCYNGLYGPRPGTMTRPGDEKGQQEVAIEIPAMSSTLPSRSYKIPAGGFH